MASSMGRLVLFCVGAGGIGGGAVVFVCRAEEKAWTDLKFILRDNLIKVKTPKIEHMQ